MNSTAFKNADILVPHDTDMNKWSVIRTPETKCIILCRI